MGRHHPSKNDDNQWPAATLTESEPKSAEHTDHHEHSPDRSGRDEKEQRGTNRP